MKTEKHIDNLQEHIHSAHLHVRHATIPLIHQGHVSEEHVKSLHF